MFEDSTTGITGAIERNQYLRCPPRFLRYATNLRSWGQFKAESTAEVESGQVAAAFKDKLELADRFKNMITALVDSRGSSKNRRRGQQFLISWEEKGGPLLRLYTVWQPR